MGSVRVHTTAGLHFNKIGFEQKKKISDIFFSENSPSYVTEVFKLVIVKSFFFKYGPIPASFSFIFVLFTLQFNYKLKKHRWSAWDLNPGPQDGRRRQNHGAMAATKKTIFFLKPYLNHHGQFRVTLSSYKYFLKMESIVGTKN